MFINVSSNKTTNDVNHHCRNNSVVQFHEKMKWPHWWTRPSPACWGRVTCCAWWWTTFGKCCTPRADNTTLHLNVESLTAFINIQHIIHIQRYTCWIMQQRTLDFISQSLIYNCDVGIIFLIGCLAAVDFLLCFSWTSSCYSSIQTPRPTPPIFFCVHSKDYFSGLPGAPYQLHAVLFASPNNVLGLQIFWVWWWKTDSEQPRQQWTAIAVDSVYLYSLPQNHFQRLRCLQINQPLK